MKAEKKYAPYSIVLEFGLQSVNEVTKTLVLEGEIRRLRAELSAYKKMLSFFMQPAEHLHTCEEEVSDDA